MSDGFSFLQFKVARQIADYARALSLPAGAYLSAQGLAREFGVSRTPVRKALLLLNEQGVVRRQKNRGFYLERAASEIEERVFDKHRSEDESLYRRISEDRLSNRAPQRFTESEFMRQYGVNRSILGRIL